jgi:putative long chain acyl-CoA synthase
MADADRGRGLFGQAIRMGQAAQNALEVARFGGLDTGEEPTSFDVVAEHRMYRLRRYLHDPKKRKRRPPVLLVPPMMLSAEVYDVSPATSAVRVLAATGVDPWVIDFGSPEHEEGGMERTLTDHVLALSRAVDEVIAATGGPIHLGGYSQGGMFCYQTAAYRQGEGLASLVTFGALVDTQGQLPAGTEDLLIGPLDFLADNVLSRFALPAWASRTGFRLMDPVKSIQQRAEFLLQLHDRDALLPREGQRRFLMDEGWVAWPGPALAELVKQFIVSNRMLSGGFVIEGRPVTLSDIDCPILCFVGSKDAIAPPPSVRAVARATPRATVYERTMEVGHFGLVVGSKAATVTWPTVAAWATRAENGRIPDGLTVIDPDRPVREGPVSDLERAAALAANIGAGAARATVAGTRRLASSVLRLAEGGVGQLPRLSRLDAVRPTTRVSIGALMAEQAASGPTDTVFLFEGRGHEYGAANERVDNVVRGLLSLGVRRGEHVGVYMDTRPSALGVVIALNRLGAVAVLLRPGGSAEDLETELELGAATRIVADPEHGEHAASAAQSLPVHVLGGGGGPRDLGSAVDDMEQIDPGAVRLPGWYVPNPGLARDLAFIVFTGSGPNTKVSRITNGRWALSAFGTASAGALTRADTVLGLTPIHHPSALLTGIGGAIASRARLAMVRRYDPDEFWDTVRRNGVTAVTYTWTMLAGPLELPPSRDEAHHPIRLFIGSGMPQGIWRRLERRADPARVLEFYASTQGDAVLVNLTKDKVGSLGRRLPGSANVRVARYDIDGGRLVEGRDGFAVECGADEVGMLLAELDPEQVALTDGVLRAMFSPGDAWLATGDLFRRDADGDHWLVGGIGSLIRTPRGRTAPIPVQDAVSTADAVHLAVAYAVPDGDGEEIAVAVTLRAGFELTPVALAEAVDGLEPRDRPRYVRVVDEIPVTTWFRVRTGPLRAEGLDVAGPVFELAADEKKYSLRRPKRAKVKKTA